MAVSPSTFIVNHPEFTNAPTPLIQAEMDNAYALTPASVWPTSMLDQGAQLLAAQALALSPFGRGLSLSDKTGRTVYDDRLDRLMVVAIAGAARVV